MTTLSLLETIHANQVQRIIPLLETILAQGTMIMTTATDLMGAISAIQAADQALQPAVQAILGYIKTLQTGGTVPDAEIEAAVSALQKASSDFSSAATSLASVTPPPPPPSAP